MHVNYRYLNNYALDIMNQASYYCLPHLGETFHVLLT
jgi:hypothetical protein